jgi:hypothetical protein
MFFKSLDHQFEVKTEPVHISWRNIGKPAGILKDSIPCILANIFALFSIIPNTVESFSGLQFGI